MGHPYKIIKKPVEWKLLKFYIFCESTPDTSGLVTLYPHKEKNKKFEPFQACRSKDIVEIAKNGPIMAQTLNQYGPNN